MTQATAKQPRVRGSGDKPVKEAAASAGTGMKIVIDQPAVARALSVVGRAVSTRPMTPMLGNIKLETGDGEVTLTASNIVLTIRTTAPCRVEQAGIIALPASTLNALVGSFNKGKEITIDWQGEGNMLTFIKSGKSVNRENGMAADDFPQPPTLVDAQVIEMPAKEFCRTLHGVLYATDLSGQQESRPYLQGVTLTFESGALTMLGSDGFRIALAKLLNEFKLDGTVELSVPSQSLREVERLFSTSTGTIRLLVGRGTDSRRVQFECDDIVVSSQVLDGTYWRGLKGTQDKADRDRKSMETALQTFNTDVRVSAEAIKQVLRRARIFAQENNNHCRLIISAEKGVEVLGHNKHGGEAYDVLEATVSGEDLETGHNLLYLLESIDNLGEIEQVRLCCNGGARPMTIMDAARSDIMTALSPMQETK